MLISIIFISGCLSFLDIRPDGGINVNIDATLVGGIVNITIDDPCFLNSSINKGCLISILAYFDVGSYNVSCYHNGILRFWEIIKVKSGEISEITFQLQKKY